MSKEDLLELQSTSSSEADSSHDSPEQTTSTSIETESTRQATELLVSLCTSHTPEVIMNLYKFHQEAQFMSTGPDVTPNSVVDITFDSYLHVSQFIKYLRGSNVPHQTVQLPLHVRNSCTFSGMQALYHSLIDSRQWTQFVAAVPTFSG